ncbi:Protein N-lysine methyltransferase METTL21A [Bienertia sinuspersici]
MEREQEDDFICLNDCHESFFINDNYHLTSFTFGSQVLELFCLHSASTDFDLTGQMILKKNVDLHASPENRPSSDLVAKKLEWGNSDQMNEIVQGYPEGFDLVLGADIYILILLMDQLVLKEAQGHGLSAKEVAGTRSVVSHLEGVIYEITL